MYKYVLLYIRNARRPHHWFAQTSLPEAVTQLYHVRYNKHFGPGRARKEALVIIVGLRNKQYQPRPDAKKGSAGRGNSETLFRSRISKTMEALFRSSSRSIWLRIPGAQNRQYEPGLSAKDRNGPQG